MAALWYPEAILHEGPGWKVGYPTWGQQSPKRGEVKHSAEGYLNGLFSELRGAVQVSWHFSISYDGVVYQHYPVTANCWHAGDTDDDGNVRANIDLVGIEHEGVAGEVLTAQQADATTRLTKWLANNAGFSSFGRYPHASADSWWLVEHNQVSNLPTACPSNRIPWDLILAALNGPPAFTISQQIAGLTLCAHALAATGTLLGIPQIAIDQARYALR